MNLIPSLIKDTRLSLGEKQSEFAKRFNVNPCSVSLWETGSREAGYKVIEFCIRNQMDMLVRIKEALNPSERQAQG